nr:MAG TPA: hypothetical protein [Bacteriophage sp.]DAK78021.1 MAG TPA: hypothetical protein [Caudoviricetes sp.]DAJ65918.1 MAG TPA: hypothetical protein [Bacteriophage sp.]DAK02034.1 MAG TPA: hypothetical protein [Bacteriophage sp.]DAK34504.1 MAG TPA: hypothetical protein [Bacteriophage sp.]
MPRPVIGVIAYTAIKTSIVFQYQLSTLIETFSQC